MSRRQEPAEPEADIPDPDIELIDAVLFGDPTDEQDAEFDRRYVEDDAFFRLAKPLFVLRLLPVDWAAMEAQLGVGGSGTAGDGIDETAGGRKRGLVGAIGSFVFGGLLKVAIAVAIIFGIGAALIVANNSRRNKPEPDRLVELRQVPAGAAGATPGAPSLPDVAPRRDTGLFARNMLTELDLRGRDLATDDSHAAMLVFPDSSRLLVQPGSSVRYVTRTQAMSGIAVQLRHGEVSFLVTSGVESQAQVVTFAGSVTLGAGAYAVRCAGVKASCEVLQVTVARGKAELIADRSDGPKAQLAGESFGRVGQGVPPAAVSAASARSFSFPAVDPSFARKP